MEPELRAAIEQRLGVAVRNATSLAGGDINRAFRVALTDGTTIFVKANSNAPGDMFRREAQGLQWLAEAAALQVPEVLAWSESAPHFLALEYLEPMPPAADFDAQLAKGLALLHSAPTAQSVTVQSGTAQWGAEHDNYIGLLPQHNAALPSWAEFFIERRLRPQLRRACDARASLNSWPSRFENLFTRIPQLMTIEPPQRLHGDLWSGNVLSGPFGQPCLVDPAVYAGHREVDLAMMHLFGGFSPRVFAAYEAHFPTLPGSLERRGLYQLYPLLVHVNLFGGSYVSSVERGLSALGV